MNSLFRFFFKPTAGPASIVLIRSSGSVLADCIRVAEQRFTNRRVRLPYPLATGYLTCNDLM
jgi:hypothetical protein